MKLWWSVFVCWFPFFVVVLFVVCVSILSWFFHFLSFIVFHVYVFYHVFHVGDFSFFYVFSRFWISRLFRLLHFLCFPVACVFFFFIFHLLFCFCFSCVPHVSFLLGFPICSHCFHFPEILWSQICANLVPWDPRKPRKKSYGTRFGQIWDHRRYLFSTNYSSNIVLKIRSPNVVGKDVRESCRSIVGLFLEYALFENSIYWRPIRKALLWLWTKKRFEVQKDAQSVAGHFRRVNSFPIAIWDFETKKTVSDFCHHLMNLNKKYYSLWHEAESSMDHGSSIDNP